MSGARQAAEIPDRCHTDQLKGALATTSGAAGTIHDTFSLMNTAATPCTLYGYVGGQLLDAQGKSMPTTIVRGQGTASIDDAPTQFTLQSGASATFVAEFSHLPPGTAPACPAAVRLELTPPDETTFLTLDLPAGAVDPCNNGTIHVSPVRP